MKRFSALGGSAASALAQTSAARGGRVRAAISRAYLTAAMLLALWPFCCHAQDVVLTPPFIFTFAGTYPGNTGSCPGFPANVGDDGPATGANLCSPTALLLDPYGQKLYIADSGYHRVRVVNTETGIINTVAGTGANNYSGDGWPATLATLSFPTGIALDSTGNLYIADKGNQRVRVVYNTGTIPGLTGTLNTGSIYTVAGNGRYGFSGDSGPALAAQLAMPYSVAIDSNGNIYISDQANERIRKVSAVKPTVGRIFTFAGTGVAGFNADNFPGLQTQLNQPTGLSISNTLLCSPQPACLFVSDFGNHRIRKLSTLTNPIVTTAAGSGALGYTGDGTVSTSSLTNSGADLSYPAAVAFDGNGNMFIADSFTSVVREVTAPPAGIITTYAGLAGYGKGAGPPNGPCIQALAATMNYPYGVAVDGSENVYVAERKNNLVREVTTTPCSSITFSSTQVNAPSAPLDVLLTINGVAIGSITPSGPFSVTAIAGRQGSTCTVDGTTVNPPGTICDVRVIFKPITLGLNSGALTVTVPGESPFTFSLAGTGTP